MNQRFLKIIGSGILTAALLIVTGCSTRGKITTLRQLDGKEFAVPGGTIADKLVLSKFPHATFKYFNNVLDASRAVTAGQVDVAAYDEPILRNIAAKTPGLAVLPEMITNDNYGFAVRKDNILLKKDIDLVVSELKNSGTYAAMLKRWLPDAGNPGAMPEISSKSVNGVLKLGTAAITEPFSFIDDTQKVVGFDIELARRIAQKRQMTLEIITMDFGDLIPALVSGQVDMIAACITISAKRGEQVLFSEPYYAGGIAALVRH